MIHNDETVISIKHKVIDEVAKLAFAGKLEEKRDDIAYNIIPGPHARFRCCIYKEREIIRQRVRLAEGKCPTNKESDNIVQVIDAACEECPIQRFTVTDNCQNCLGKACIKSCNFGAITSGKHRTYIDPDKCKECGMCAKACPYNAISDTVRPCKRSCPVGAITMDDNDLCVIDESKCIQCGRCIHGCPFGAIGSKTAVVEVINAIREGKKVYGMIAPSAEGQFGPEITMDSWRTALKKTGFEDMIELSLGGDLTAYAEATEWIEAYKEGKKMTTSCCPAFVALIRNHYPMLEENMSTTASPMVGVSRAIKDKDPNAITVFIGPCVAKKNEVKDSKIPNNADYALTFSEVRSIMRAKGVILEPEKISTQQGSVYGKRFGNSAGVTNAVIKSMKEQGEDLDIKVNVCNGIEDCKKALLLMKVGKLPEDFIEGMACIGGCVGGPSSHKDYMKAKKDRDTLIFQADDRGVFDNLKFMDADKVEMHREEHI